ncbi:MAG: hypothetical protein K9N46_01360 [Candidatus Marinimicrobia bacterium]|nr:hypothetical protein [Candidatus Neomarinimicrobiota bacterium]MCF7827876.1 hypothetical protein [Candidatus Neomarinimicrobiota bacterium]MCF7879369.1 hypothetical protein [Candidatus Neomarinimicrobiota bacterium]
MKYIIQSFSIVLSFTVVILLQAGAGDLVKKELPADFQANRIYVTPVTQSGDTLRFYTDTGGGVNMVWPSVVKSLELDTMQRQMRGQTGAVASLPDFSAEAEIPLPPKSSSAFGNKLGVRRPHQLLKPGGTGFLGAPWFATRIWEFDYPGQSLSIIPEMAWTGRSDKHTVHLGFYTGPDGNKTTHFPRMTIEVDGDSIDVLFDTGATALAKAGAAEQLGYPNISEIGTCFIIDSIFTGWQEAHPEWEVIENAERQTGMPMIQVPEVGIAGYEVGPVWFTKRPDKSFTGRMSRWMDKPIYGAVGGSAFQYFRIIVDYPNQMAEFHLEDS